MHRSIAVLLQSSTLTRLAALSASIRGMLQIVEVEPLTARIVRLTLSDGSVVDRDLADVLWGPVFERIAREDAVFREVHVRNGTIAWSEEADLAPETVIWGTWPPRQGQRPPTTMRVPNLTD